MAKGRRVVSYEIGRHRIGGEFGVQFQYLVKANVRYTINGVESPFPYREVVSRHNSLALAEAKMSRLNREVAACTL